MNSTSMAKWASNNHKLSCRGVNENDLMMGNLLYKKSGIDFMQNCDLPPPLKVFSGPDNTVLSSMMNRVFGTMGPEEDDDSYEFDVCTSSKNKKLELLKALRLSQTRAREAEKKAGTLAKEMDTLSKVFLEDSLRLFAYHQWMRLLEVQVSKLRSHRETEEYRFCCGHGKEEEENDGENGIEVSWVVAFAFCLGFVGVAFAFGCKHWF